MVRFLEYSGEKLVPMDNVAETGRKPVCMTYGLHYLGAPFSERGTTTLIFLKNVYKSLNKSYAGISETIKSIMYVHAGFRLVSCMLSGAYSGNSL